MKNANEDVVVELDDGSLIIQKRDSCLDRTGEGFPTLKGAANPIKINKLTGNITKPNASNIVEYNDTTQYLQHMAQH